MSENHKSNGVSPAPTASVHDSHILVRERRFPSTQDITALMKFLRDNHSTGLLMINLSQGSICTVRYREEINVTEP